MSGTRSVGVRIEANAKQAEAEVQGFAATAEAAMARVGASTERVGPAAETTSKHLRGIAMSLDRVAASADPLEGSYQKWARANDLVTNAQQKGVAVTETHMGAVARLRSDYERLAVTYEATARASTSVQGAQATAAATATRSLAGMVSANDNAGSSAGRLAAQVQNAGHQVGDFAVQIASGQSAVTAMAQQLPQLLGGFGMVGAVAGAAVAIGAVIYRLVEGVDALKQHDELLKKIDDQYSSTTKAAEEWGKGMDDEARRLGILRGYYQSLPDDIRQYEQRRLEAQRASLSEDAGRLRSEVLDAAEPLSRRISAGRRAVDVENSRNELLGQPLREMQPEMAEAERLIASLQLSTADAAQASLDFANALGELKRSGALTDAEVSRIVKTVDALRPKLVENAEATGRVSSQLVVLSDQAAPGAAGALENLNRVARAAADPFASLNATINNTNQRLEALRTGGLSALRQATAAQDDASKITQIEARLAQEHTEQLKKRGATEAEIQKAVEEAAAERRRLANEAVGQARTLASETEAAEERKREAERKAAEGRRAASVAHRADLRADREEAKENLTIFDRLRVSSRSELLLGSDGDVRAEQAIAAKMRGTSLDPDVRKRAQDKVERDLKSSQERQQRLVERSTDSIVEYGADRFADLFDKNGAGWAGMLETFESTAKSTFARIAAEAVIRPIVTPLVGPVMGAVSSAGLGGGAAASGGATGIMGAVGTSISGYASGALSIGKSLMGSGMSNTGWGWLDNGLNAPAYTGGAEQFGPMSAANPTQAFSGSVSYGQALGGAAGVAGGLYGIYTGAQTGGAKGWSQGIGGAAGMVAGASSLAGGSAALGAGAAGVLGAGGGAALGAVAAAAPYVAIAALIASYFLSGQKPSDMTGVYRSNLQTGLSDVTGLDGDRFSQENRDLASNLGKSVSDMATSLRGALGVSSTPFNFEIAAGARDGLVGSYGGKERNYSNDEAGAKQLIAEMTTAIIDSMKGLATAEVQSVLSSSSGIEETLANLDWYNSTYKSFVDSVDPTKVSSFVAAQKKLNDDYAPMIQKASELGLSLVPITSSLTKQLEAMEKARTTQFDASVAGMISTTAGLRGGNQLGVQLAGFDRQRTTDWEALVAQILDQGFDQNQVDDAWKAFIPMKELQRQGIVDQDQSARTSSRNSLLDRLEAANGTADTEAGALAAFERRAQVERQAAAKDGVTECCCSSRRCRSSGWRSSAAMASAWPMWSGSGPRPA